MNFRYADRFIVDSGEFAKEKKELPEHSKVVLEYATTSERFRCLRFAKDWVNRNAKSPVFWDIEDNLDHLDARGDIFKALFWFTDDKDRVLFILSLKDFKNE